MCMRSGGGRSSAPKSVGTRLSCELHTIAGRGSHPLARTGWNLPLRTVSAGGGPKSHRAIRVQQGVVDGRDPAPSPGRSLPPRDILHPAPRAETRRSTAVAPSHFTLLRLPRAALPPPRNAFTASGAGGRKNNRYGFVSCRETHWDDETRFPTWRRYAGMGVGRTVRPGEGRGRSTARRRLARDSLPAARLGRSRPRHASRRSEGRL